MTEDDNNISDDKVSPVFHYNRENRIAHAPESVQKAWKEGYTPQRGILRGLTANAGLKSILFSIVFLCLAIILVSLFGEEEGSATFDGFNFKLKAFLFDETIFVTLTTTSNQIQDGPVPVLVILKGLDELGEVVTESSVEGLFTGKELLLRTTMRDYEIKKIKASINIKKSTLEILVSVDRT